MRFTLSKTIIFSLLPTVILFFLAETSVRLIKGTVFSTKNAREEGYDILQLSPFVYDPYFGHIPKPGAKFKYDSRKSWSTSINENGFRSNGDTVTPQGKPIIAVGDSFTFGHEVNDNETWPAYLEKIMARPVINGGVDGYGMDQAVMMAENILKKIDADTLIISLIPDDILRNEMSVRAVGKPYFSIENGRLVLHNEHLESSKRRSDIRWVIGYSYCLNSLFSRLARNWWFGLSDSAVAHHQGMEVGKLLIDRLVLLGKEKEIKILLVIEGTKEVNANIKEMAVALPILERAGKTDINTLNLIPELNSILGSDPKNITEMFLYTHMSDKGNRWVAEKIADKLQRME